MCVRERERGGEGGGSKKDGSKKKQEYIYAEERETPEGVGGWVSGTPESNKRLKTISFFLFRKKQNDPGNFFASSFLRREKKPLTHYRSSKYDAGQKIKVETPESSDVRKRKVPKFSASKHGTN